MKIKYRYVERLPNHAMFPVVVSKEDVLRIVGNPSNTSEENDTLVEEYLKSKNATRVYDGSFNEYQLDTRLTAIYPKSQALPYLTLGIASEAGEVAGKYKKVIRDHSGDINSMSIEWKKDLLSELGDVLWYVARIADEMGVSLSEVAEKNIEKLTDRKSRNALQGSGDNR